MSHSFTPWRWLDDPAAVYLTSDRVLRVDGSGGRGWLNSLLTADLRDAAPGVARYALLLSPAGGIVSDAWVVEEARHESEKLALVLPATCAERVYETLERYLLNEKVTLSFDDAIRVVTIHGTRGRELAAGPVATFDAYSCARLGHWGLDVWAPASEVDGVVSRLSAAARQLGGGAIVGLDWSSARVALGVPQAGIDFDEKTSPHEAGLEGRAVSFSKGCYLGQELVARQRRRGELSQRLIQLAIEGVECVADGSTVRDPGGEEVGRLTSVAPVSVHGSVLALAYVTPRFAQLGTRVRVEERPAEVRRVVGLPEPPTTGEIG